MTTEKTDQANEAEEKPSMMDCCSPQKFAEMMAKCGGSDMKGGCCAMMQQMMKGGFGQPEQK